MVHPYYRLMFVSRKNTTHLSDYLSLVQECAEAGITAVQLREKHLSDDELMTLGRAIQAVLLPFHIPLIINDRIHVALALNADGVHLGQTDGDPYAARQLLGHHKIIGVTIDSIEQLMTANQLPIDYVGVGSIFPTQNKANVITHWGLTGLKTLKPLTKHPIIAIGGINQNNAAAVLQAGADGIAAIGAFHDDLNPTSTIPHLLQVHSC